MQAETTIRYYLTLVRLAIIKKKNLQTINAGEDVEMHSWWGYKLIQPLWRTVWRFLKKLEINLPYDPTTPLLGIYPEKTRKMTLFRDPRKDQYFSSVQFSSVTQSCPTLCDPMNHSTPGLPVHHQLPEFTQTHVHRVSDAIQPSRLLSSPSPPAPNPSQHQSLFL